MSLKLPAPWVCGLKVAALLGLLSLGARGQSLIMSDDFESPGTTVNTALWPYSGGTRVESGQDFFGGTNRYLHVAGAGVKALSANWSSALNSKGSTFAFDYYEPSVSGDSLIIGYAAGTSDINSAGALVRIAVGGGSISSDATDGTVVTNSGTLTYPRDTRLTFSLALNHAATNQPFHGTNLAAKTMDVWYYNWTNQQMVFVLSIDVAASTRSPVCAGFRTWSASTNAQFYIDNARLLDAPVVVTPDLALSNPPAAMIIPPPPLAHPCILNSQQDLDRIKYRINHEPGSTALLGWNRLRSSAYASLSYQHFPYSNVVVVASGTTNSETQFRNDGQAAWAAALQWAITGDPRYRDKAVTIMNDWAGTFITLSPAPGTSSSQLRLEAAWYLPVWVAAADIIRYYNQGAAGWGAADIAKFDALLNYLHGQAAQAATMANNWGASAALAMMAVGAYQDNRSRFDAGVQAWRDNLLSVNAAVANNGYINEVCRDTTHPQYTLQVWMQAAEIAWKQGLDLYGTTLNGSPVPQFVINLENFAGLFLGLAQAPCSASFLTNYHYLGQQSSSGAYDIAYNHYLLRIGLTDLPRYADLVVNHWRPGGVDTHFCPWSALTHGDLSAGIPVVAAFGLWNTASNAFVATLTEGGTLNLRNLGGQGLAVQTTGVVSSVQYFTNGGNLGSVVTNAPFLLSSWPPPGNYYLSVVPSQSRSAGSIPGDPLMRFVRIIDLPEPWSLEDLGPPAVPAWAKETAGAITLTAAGSNFSGTADEGGMVSAVIAGDLQLTARIVTMTPVGAPTRAGLMVRDGTGPGARQVCLAPSGTNVATFSSRANPQGSTTVSNTTLVSSPLWLRLVRLGNVFTGYYSANGMTWVSFGAATVSMNTAVRAGLAVASGSVATPAQAVFENVLLEPLNASYAEWQKWMFAWRGLANSSAAEEADPDGDGRSNLAEYWLGSDPLVSDGAPAVSVTGVVNGPLVGLRFVERKNAASLGRKFWHSTDLLAWALTTPVSITDLQDLGSVMVREVTFPASVASGFYRASYAP